MLVVHDGSLRTPIGQQPRGHTASAGFAAVLSFAEMHAVISRSSA